MEVKARAKLFGTAQALPSHDLQRRLDRTPAYDGSADFRLMLRHTAGSVTILADHALTLVSGDSYGLLRTLQPTLDQSPAGGRPPGGEPDLGNPNPAPGTAVGGAWTALPFSIGSTIGR